MSCRHLVVTAACTALALGGLSAAEQWPQFRGSNGAVADDHPTLPDTWSETENVVWKTDIPGLSWSSPIVWEDHVFVTSAISSGTEEEVPRGLSDPIALGTKSTASHRWVVYDVDANTGAIRWERMLHDGPPPVARHPRTSYAPETPVTDGERIYVYFGNVGVVAALDMTGEVVWRADVDALDDQYGWGHASSPVLHDDRLFIVNDNATRSFIAAFDTKTGAELWQRDRDEVEGFATPFVWENELRTEVVTTGAGAVRSYGLDGSLLWQLTGLGVPVPTPFARHGLVYVSSGYPGDAVRPVYAIRPGGAGDLSLDEGETSNEFIAWFQPRIGSYQTSALVYGDYFYTLLDRGLLWCHDARTGEEVYPRQRIGRSNQFAASPWAYNSKVFLLSEDGDTYVVRAGPGVRNTRHQHPR